MLWPKPPRLPALPRPPHPTLPPLLRRRQPRHGHQGRHHQHRTGDFRLQRRARDFEELSKKFEPKQNELKGKADEIDSLKKQLSAQQDKLNDESRDKLVKQIEAKQKSFDRATQDAQEDFQNQQGEIGNKILTKMAPLIVKYASDNGYGMILDTSQQWPRGPVIWYGPAVDITQPIVEAYNTQSGVPAPAAGTTAQQAGGKTGAQTRCTLRALRRNSSDTARVVSVPGCL